MLVHKSVATEPHYEQNSMNRIPRGRSLLNPLTPKSDQDGISLYIINTVSSIQVSRIKKKTQLGNYKLICNQILQLTS